MDNQHSFIVKLSEKSAYLFLRISLLIGAFVATFFTYFSFLIRVNQKKKKDFLLLPYTYKNNIGVISRFQVYLPYLDKDGYTYDIDYLYEEKYYLDIYLNNDLNRTKEYLLNSRVFWRRLKVALSARNYKAIFIQRAAYPELYDQTFPYLERLMSKLNNNITIDFFDAEYARNRKLTDTSVKFSNKVSVVNKHLFNYFSQLHPRIYYNNLSIDTKAYIQKKNYSLHKPVDIFWTGNDGNAANLAIVIPVLEKINKEIPVKLTMISHTKAGFTSALIDNKKWDAKTFFHYLADADIAIYPAIDDTEFSRGKVAYKVLDYVSAKVPVIASPLGLSQNFEHDKDLLIANNEVEWEMNFRRMIGDEQLRKRLADNAYQKLLKYHEVRATYENFVKILLS